MFFCPFYGLCAKLNSNVKWLNFGIVLKRVRTTCRVPNFFVFKNHSILRPAVWVLPILKNENGRDPAWGQPSHVVALVLLLKKIKINCPILIRIQKLFLQDLNSFHVGIRENTEAKYRAIIIKEWKVLCKR